MSLQQQQPQQDRQEHELLEQQLIKSFQITQTIAAASIFAKAGRAQDSIKLLRSALEEILRYAKSDNVISEPCPEVVVLEEVCVLSNDDMSLKSDDSSKTVLSSSSSTESSLGIFNLYSKSLRFGSQTSDSIFQYEEHHHRASAIILYNMALVYHMQGFKGYQEQKSYQFALKFYQMALDTLSNVSFYQTSEADKTISLAIVNNKGHIHSQKFEYIAVQQCVSWVKSMLNICCGADDLFGSTDLMINLRLVVMIWGADANPPVPASSAA